jgi:hypothetical protein
LLVQRLDHLVRDDQHILPVAYLCWLPGTSVRKKREENDFFTLDSVYNLLQSYGVQFQFYACICVQSDEKLYLFLENFEHEEDFLLQFYVSSRLQRNGNNYRLCATIVLATCHILPLNQAFESTFPCLSQLADSLEEEYHRNAFICLSSIRIGCSWCYWQESFGPGNKRC